MNAWSVPFLLALLMLASCVSNKKYVYMQRDDVNQKIIPKDTALRTYPTRVVDYVLQPNDAVYVDIRSIGDKQFDFFSIDPQVRVGGGTQGFIINSELVDPDGFISFPVVGKIPVAGKTIFEVQEQLQKVAEQYLESPVVKVRLVNFRFTVLGEVVQEGTIGSLNNRVTLPEAIGLAGGISDLADKQNIKIVRTVNNRTQVAYINLLDEAIISSPYYVIHQGDLIIVPALKQRPYRKYFGQNITVFIASISLLLTIINLSK
jgi:polysaccharide export outer membrane protein